LGSRPRSRNRIAIARESGTTRAFTLDGAKSIGLPTVTVVYEFDQDTVVIHDALFEVAAYDQSGLA
jgi:hypothetical protein